MKQYDDEFKREAVRLAEKAEAEGRSKATIAHDLGINPNNLYNWINKSVKDADGSIITDSELTKLRKEVRDLREERDILKKAVAIFSKQQK